MSGRVLGKADLVAFVATTDLGRARAFYAETLGLTLVDENPSACVFDANGTSLRVTAAPELEPAGYTVLGWLVDDISSAVRELVAREVELKRFEGMDQDEQGVWTTPGGDKVAWFADPDGNLLSLTQLS
jgi:catechol 2,3-dioxygenase-like lactoylglutathione lyase family enzyme